MISKLDSIRGTSLYNALKNLSIPSKIITLVKMTLARTELRWEGSLSSNFQITRIKARGSIVDSAFQLGFRNENQREWNIFSGHDLQLQTSICLASADDIVLMARTRKELARIFGLLESKAEEYGLHVNEGKTKYMEMNGYEMEEET